MESKKIRSLYNEKLHSIRSMIITYFYPQNFPYESWGFGILYRIWLELQSWFVVGASWYQHSWTSWLVIWRGEQLVVVKIPSDFRMVYPSFIYEAAAVIRPHLYRVLMMWWLDCLVIVLIKKSQLELLYRVSAQEFWFVPVYLLLFMADVKLIVSITLEFIDSILHSTVRD